VKPVYSVRFAKSARKEFDQLPARVQQRFEEALLLLSANPFSELLRAKKIKGADDLYRVRSGEYRLVYEIRRGELVVIVIKIAHRSEVYRQL
jgi:mRNA interferase RelE/StbE